MKRTRTVCMIFIRKSEEEGNGARIILSSIEVMSHVKFIKASWRLKEKKLLAAEKTK